MGREQLEEGWKWMSPIYPTQRNPSAVDPPLIIVMKWCTSSPSNFRREKKEKEGEEGDRADREIVFTETAPSSLPPFAGVGRAGRGGDPENWDEGWRIKDKGRRREGGRSGQMARDKGCRKKTATPARRRRKVSSAPRWQLSLRALPTGDARKKKLKCNHKKSFELWYDQRLTQLYYAALVWSSCRLQCVL